MAVRVVLADDHRLLRESLRLALVSAGLQVVGEAADGRQAIAEALATRPDVVLMDVTMPELDGIEATRELTAAAPEVRVVVLTAHDDDEILEQARRAGAAGYLCKDTAIDAVVRTVQRAADGVPPTHEDADVGWWAAEVPDGPAPLTDLQIRLLHLLANGVGTEAVAEHLVVGRDEVRRELATIYDQLGVDSRSEAVAVAVRAGWIQVD